MAKKIEISGNYTLVTDTVTTKVIFEAPTASVRYIRKEGTVELFPNDSRTYQKNIKVDTTQFVDSGDAIIADIYLWLQTNTGV